MTQYTELLTRLRAATAEDCDDLLDVEIAKTFGYKIGWKQHSGTMESRPWWIGKWGKEPLPKFSSSIDAALALVGEKLPEWQVAVDISPKHGRACCRLREGIGAEPFEECAPTAPLAILMALVTAMEGQS